ncbi:PLP-dependent aminotransferase family protein [Pseudonocardia ailaonensis]|uniref:PLP-dependent aminotransferase family protein n=2 Tax=Pseudonocardia ailaonensis TaxID=367279 RepID=A0ABN2N1X7_9PSEU
MEALREAVRSGRLAPGVRLPSSRSLAADLGIARNTVAQAYAELVAEGWLTARQGSVTRVAQPRAGVGAIGGAPATGGLGDAPRRGTGGRGDTPGRGPGAATGGTSGGPGGAGAGVPRHPERPRHDLRPGRPDVSSFPRAEWLRATRRALAAAPDEAFGYGGPRGRPELREALATYLARARGVRTDPGHIMICSGAAHALQLIATVMRHSGIAVESHGLHVHRELLAVAGVRTPALPIDEHGARAGELAGLDVGAALLTPAHQFPTGVALHPERRAAAVDWARTRGGLLIEDDYDAEFRYDRQPVGALQSLDPDHVALLGTVSKSLAPGVRLGWIVAPAALLTELDAAKGHAEHHTATVDQLVLAELLRSGAYDRHVRARRLAYRRRRDQLVATLAERVPQVRVRGLAAGLHATVELAPGTAPAVARSAAWHGVATEPLSLFRHPDAAPLPDALVVGYATPSDSAWPTALTALTTVLTP